MGTGLEIGLVVASVAAAAASAAAAAQAAKQQADAQAAAAAQNFALQDAEMVRQQEELNRIAMEDKGDVVIKAEQQLGSVYANAGDLGVSEGSVARMVAEIGAYEGMDLSRIEGNRRAEVASRQASKKAAAQGSVNTVTQANLNLKSAQTQALVGFIGTGLSVGTKYSNQRRLEARTQRTS